MNETDMLIEATKTGSIVLIKHFPFTKETRLLVTLGNESRPINVSDQLLKSLGVPVVVH